MDRQRDPDRHPRQQHERHVRLLPGFGGRLRRCGPQAEDIIPAEHDRKIASHAVLVLHHGLLAVKFPAADLLPDGKRRFNARRAGQKVRLQHALAVLSEHDLASLAGVRIEKFQNTILPVPCRWVIERGHLPCKGLRRRQLPGLRAREQWLTQRAGCFGRDCTAHKFCARLFDQFKIGVRALPQCRDAEQFALSAVNGCIAARTTESGKLRVHRVIIALGGIKAAG